MDTQAQEILRAALALGPIDRSIVADLLYGSLDLTADQAAINDAWSEEVANRIRDVDAGKAELLPMDAVEKRFRDKGILWD